MLLPKVGQIWFNTQTEEFEEIISVGDRILTDKYDCHFELFLEQYNLAIFRSVENLNNKIQELKLSLNEIADQEYALQF